MENTVNTILAKKLEDTSYIHNNLHNFNVDGELTVTITLKEYRELITADAKSSYELSKKSEECYKIRSERDAALKQVEQLKAYIAENLVNPVPKETDAE